MPFEAYCTDEDLAKALGGAAKLAMLSSQSGAMDPEVTKRARMMGAQEIDAKARLLPSFDWHDNPPDLAVSVNIDLAIYHLYKLTYRKLSDAVKEAYDNAIAKIAEIGISSAWDNTNLGAGSVASSVRFSTPNTPLSTGESLYTRMSHSSDTDYL